MNKDIEVNDMVVIICKALCLITAKYIFFPSACKIFTKTNLINYANDASEAQDCLSNHIHPHGFNSSLAQMLPDLGVFRSFPRSPLSLFSGL